MAKKDYLNAANVSKQKIYKDIEKTRNCLVILSLSFCICKNLNIATAADTISQEFHRFKKQLEFGVSVKKIPVPPILI